MKRYILAIFLSLVSNMALAGNIDDLTWIAQDYPPYSYVDTKGENKGPLIDLVGQVLSKADSSKSINDIEIRTFSKMFMYSNNNENTVFFPLAKTADRESYFKWVGPIFVNKPVIFAKSTNRSTDKGLTGRKPIVINTINDLKNYTIIGRDKYTGVTQLQNAGINVQIGNSDAENLIALKNDQVQMAICDENVGYAFIKKLGLVPEDYQVVYKLDESEMYFAFNKDTDDELVNQVKDLLKNVKMKNLN